MDREFIIGQIIREFEERTESIVRRDLQVPLDTSLRKAISIVGPRRAGKTFFLLSIYQEVREHFPSIFLLLDDDRIYPPSLSDLNLALKVLYERFPSRERFYLFLDEIQEVVGWERFVKRVVERENCLVYLSGSSSRLLSKEIASVLRGRTLTYEIFPFSFREILRARGVEVDKYISSSVEAQISKELRFYLEYGGFPEVVLKSEKEKILREYVHVMLYRDIIERYKLKNLSVVRMFFKMVFTGFARSFSVNRIANYMQSLGLKTSKNSLYNYLEYMNDAYIAFPVKRFSMSQRLVEQSIPKVYVVDNGLVRVFNVLTPEIMGHLLENLVFIELRKKGLRENENIFYYKENHKEIDFVIVDKGIVRQLIQVTYNLRYDDKKQWKREVETLAEVSKKLRCRNLLIVTWSQEGEIVVGKAKVKVLPLWKWILYHLPSIRVL